MRIPIVGATYKLADRSFNAQRCANFYIEVSESNPNISRLVHTPGKELFVTAGTGPIRGGITTAGGRCFVVSGREVYELSILGTATLRGEINSSVGHISMAENGTQLVMVDGVNGYIFTFATNNLSQIADVDFPNGSTVVEYMDTYFMANDPGTGDFYISANNNGTSWAAIDKTTVESSPDNLVGFLADHADLICGGDDKTEIYYNSGDATFPFERRPQAVLQVGLAAAHTLKSWDNTAIWLAKDKKGGRFVATLNDANRHDRVSTQAIEELLASVPDVSASTAYVYTQGKHEFYVLKVPGLDTDLVLDAATREWHERTYYNTTLNVEQQDRASCHMAFNGMNLVGDRESGNIYRLRTDYYTDNGDAIHRIRIASHVSNEQSRIYMPTLYLDCQTGVGLQSGQGQDPQVMMATSKDKGRTYGNERWRSFGAAGEYTKRPYWTRNGSAYDFTFMFRVTDPVPVSIYGLYAR